LLSGEIGDDLSFGDSVEVVEFRADVVCCFLDPSVAFRDTLTEIERGSCERSERADSAQER
jgi:hypothetical protein